MNPRVLVGVLACNHKAKTLACLTSLAASDYRDFDVFLLDNGSGEEIAEAARKFSFVTADTRPKNIGASAGRNLILRYFLNRGDWSYLLFLDNDMRVASETLGTVVRKARELQSERRPLGALGAHIIYRNSPEKYWSAGGALMDWENSWFREQGQGGIRGRDFSEPRRLEAIPTAFLFATREAVEKTGDFAEDYFFYFEDADWSWRMAAAGFELWSVPEAVAAHDVSSSLGKCSPGFYFLRTRNRLWFFQRFSPKSSGEIRRKIFKSVLWESAYPEFRAGHFKEALAVIRGFWAGLRQPKKLQRVPSASSMTGEVRKLIPSGPAL